MRVKIGECYLEIIRGNIVDQDTEAIVNAANEELIPGGGVDGAIHKAGGPSIAQEVRKIGRCPTGEAVITGAGKLKAKYVIHTVGPIYKGGDKGEAQLLAKAYDSSLKLALKKGISSIAFPSISTGAYRYPMKEAAQIALESIINFLKEKKAPSLVRMVLWSSKAYEIYKEVLSSMIGEKFIIETE